MRAEARDFQHSGEAVVFALASQAKDLEVVLAFDAPEYDFAIPIALPGAPPTPDPDRPFLL